jgi:hypothetical protein
MRAVLPCLALTPTLSRGEREQSNFRVGAQGAPYATIRKSHRRNLSASEI